MNKLYLFITTLLSLLTFKAVAGPGDTTVVNGHTDVVIQTDPGMSGSTHYSNWSVFPSTTAFPYRRVMAYLTFECAPGLSCGEWDYINRIYIQRTGGVGGDSLGYEMGKFITPYGFYWSSEDDWKHGWWLDVTDWGYLLHDSVEIVYEHTGYEGTDDRGWKINLKYYIIEGTPVRDFKAMTPMWSKGYTYGDPSHPFNDSIAEKTVTLNSGTQSAMLWVMQTGHGADNTDGCGEFCAKTRTIKLDGTGINSQLLWRECGDNSLYPQAGTWILDRANWCPGATVIPSTIELGNSFSPGSTHTLDLEMEEYTATADFGGYDIRSYLFEYGAINAVNDVTLDAILAPSKEYETSRFNPVCGQPVIVIRNSGSAPLTSVQVKYGIAGGTAYTYDWTGDLAFMEKDTLVLSGQSWEITGTTNFEVSLLSPNGTTDEFESDNAGASTMEPVPQLPAGFIVEFKSTKAYKETQYKIINAATGAVAFERPYSSFASKGTYRDTVALDTNTCYILRVEDYGAPITGGIDVNSDGLSFWYWDVLADNYPEYLSYIDNDDGTFKFLNYPSGTALKDFTANFTTSKTTLSGSDFGSGITYQFVTNNERPVGLDDVRTDIRFNVYPNPSLDGKFNVSYSFSDSKNAQIIITDIAGKVLQTIAVDNTTGNTELNLGRLAKGIYLMRFQTEDGRSTTQKLIYK